MHTCSDRNRDVIRQIGRTTERGDMDAFGLALEEKATDKSNEKSNDKSNDKQKRDEKRRDEKRLVLDRTLWLEYGKRIAAYIPQANGRLCLRIRNQFLYKQRNMFVRVEGLHALCAARC
jgi:hypothetical protein